MNASVSKITAFGLTTAQPERTARFYEGLGFAIGEPTRIPDEVIALLGLERGGTRRLLRLGAQRIHLDAFDDPGLPYPAHATSADLCFQHFALVTDDVAAAWNVAVTLGAIPISSGGPLRLPAREGGVTAVKFRDPEGHPLELLQFPADGTKLWQGSGLIGIDHSAISVADAEASRRFYESLGLCLYRPTLNQGPGQNALDGLPRSIVDVLPMKAGTPTPHLELLGYRVPAGRAAGRLAANDVTTTRIEWQADRDAMLRDPDGHVHLLRAISDAGLEHQS